MILDTCALLWLASGDKRLSRSALKEITKLRQFMFPPSAVLKSPSRWPKEAHAAPSTARVV